MNPFMISAGILALRKMRKMNENTLSTYMNLTLMLIMVPAVFLTGSDLSPFKSFSLLCWVYLFIMSYSVNISQRMRIKAF